QLYQLSGTLRTRVLRGMVEPAWANGHIGLAGAPHAAAWIAMLQHLRHRVSARAGEWHDFGIHGGPVRIAGDAALVPNPSDVRTRVREDDRLWLQSPDQRPGARPIVHLLASAGAFTVGAVEPDFMNATVLREQLGELRAVEIVIAGRVTVRMLVPVPRRKVQSSPEPLRRTRVHELAHDVARAASPRASGHAVFCCFCWPETEAVVMLGREDHCAEASAARAPRPLPRIEVRGREQGGILLSVTPFAIGEGVHAKVHEHRQLVALPLELRGRGVRPCAESDPWEDQRPRDGGEELPAASGRHGWRGDRGLGG